MNPTCVVCGRPMADQAYACSACGQKLAQTLSAASGHAEDAEAVIARQTRHGAGSRGGSDAPLPGDLTAAARLDDFAATIGGWARIVTEESGRRPRWRPMAGPLCPATGERCGHDSCASIRRRWPGSVLALETAWLSRQTGWLRRHPAAGEAFADLHKACEDLARLNDGPTDKRLVGVCDCGRVMYATGGQRDYRCPAPCGAEWNVEDSRDILRRHLGDKLVTAAEAARLAAYLDSDRTQEQIRKLINKWSERATLLAHGRLDGEQAFRFGDVAERLATSPRRERRSVAA